MSSLLTGLTRSSFHPMIDGELEEEETHYMTLDIAGIDPSLLSNCSSIRLAGLETSTPFLQLGDLVFQGTHTETLGTELVLDDVGVIAQSGHKVLFNPVQLIPKSEPNAGAATEVETPSGSHDLDTTSGGGAPRPTGRGRASGRGRARGSRARGKKRVQD